MADPSSILVEVEVDEADIANVRIDQKADIFAVAFPDKALVGEVQSIATSAKRTDRRQGLSFTVKILLDGAGDIDIRPGMSCRAEIFTSVKGDTVAVPIEAIIFEEAGADESDIETEQDANSISVSGSASEDASTHVFIMVDGEATKRDVELGISNDQLQEIVAGLEIGDQVIAGPARTLRKLDEGQAVEEIEKKDQ